MLLTGFSAGGVGSTVTYPLVRGILQPTGNATLLADSGPLMPAPRSGTARQYPSLPLHEKIRDAWGLDGPDGLVTRFAGVLSGFDVNDLGSVSGALALTYPGDRFGFMLFTRDTNFSAFSYEKFFADIANARHSGRLPAGAVLALVARHRALDREPGDLRERQLPRPLLPQRQRLALPDDHRLLRHRHRSRPASPRSARSSTTRSTAARRCATSSPRTTPTTRSRSRPSSSSTSCSRTCSADRAQRSRRGRGRRRDARSPHGHFFSAALPSGKRAASFLSLPRSALTPGWPSSCRRG